MDVKKACSDSEGTAKFYVSSFYSHRSPLGDQAGSAHTAEGISPCFDGKDSDTAKFASAADCIDHPASS